jgi:hypothetical protein
MPAIWRTPIDWNVGQLVTAEEMNFQLRDNLLWLKSPPMGTANLAASINTTSTTFTLATGLSIPLTSTGGRMLLSASFPANTNVGSTAIYFTFAIDTTLQGDAVNGIVAALPTGAALFAVSLSYLTAPLTAGVAYTFSVRWRVSANQGTIGAGAHFFAREV